MIRLWDTHAVDCERELERHQKKKGECMSSAMADGGRQRPNGEEGGGKECQHVGVNSRVPGEEGERGGEGGGRWGERGREGEGVSERGAGNACRSV